MRLLVVEDDRDLNRQIASALEAAGYAVDRAFDGEEGWFRGDTEPYDAIVLDIGLPKRDGISILRGLAQGRPRDAGADPDRARSLERQGAGHRRRRGRLCREAFPHGGGAGAAPRGVAPRRRSRDQRSRCRPGAARRARRTRRRQRRAGQANQSRRIPAAVLSDASRRTRHLARRNRRASLESRISTATSNTIEVFIGRLRKKLGVDIIKTARGLGYLVGVDAETPAAR